MCSRTYSVIFVLYFVTTICSSNIASDKTTDHLIKQVLKNITSINVALNKIINNYERIKKEYSSQESFENDRTEEIVNRGKENTRRPLIDKPTQMILSDELTTQDTDTNRKDIDYYSSVSSDRKDSIETNSTRKVFNFAFKTEELDYQSTEEDYSEHSNLKEAVRLLIQKIKPNSKAYNNRDRSRSSWNYFGDLGQQIERLDGTKSQFYVVAQKEDYSSEQSIEELESDFSVEDKKQTHVLRNAYGEACTKMVVRKCFKACRQARKRSCREYRCKKKFRSNFKKASKDACISAFKLKTNKTFRAEKSEENNKKFNDLTRGGLQNCYPFNIIAEDSQSNVALRNETAVNYLGKKINILRDKYERACNKASANACRTACTQSYEEACGKNECRKGMKKSFRKSCKAECRSSYSVKSSDKSDDDDSDDDDDDDDDDGSD